MTLTLIETFKTSIYSPKHIQNTKTRKHTLNFTAFPNSSKNIFIKFLSSTHTSVFYVDFYDNIYIVEGHTGYLVVRGFCWVGQRWCNVCFQSECASASTAAPSSIA